VDVRNFLQLLRDRWKLIFLVTLIAAGGSAALTARTAPRYASSVTMYVSAETNTSDPAVAYDGALLSQQTVQSFANLLTGTRLAASVVSYLGLPMTAPQLAAEISARPIPQTVLLTATVTDASPQRAQLIASAVGSRFVHLASVLSRPLAGQPATVHVTVVARATTPGGPVSPKPVRNVGIALAFGNLRDRVRRDIERGLSLAPDVDAPSYPSVAEAAQALSARSAS